MSSIEQMNRVANRLIKAGAEAVYISDSNGFEVCFVGNKKFRDILTLLPSIRSWLLYKLEMEFMMDIKSRYNLSMRCDDISIIQVKFRIGNMDCILFGHGGISIASIYPSQLNIPFALIIETLREVRSILNGVSFISKSEITSLLKKEILEARKSLSIGDKENLITSLSKIKLYLNEVGVGSLNVFVDYIDRLLESLASDELTSEMRIKIKRGLLLMFRSILKSLENEI